jgi:hypothetical protein
MRIRDLLLSACGTMAVFASADAGLQLSTTDLLAEIPQCAVSVPIQLLPFLDTGSVRAHM